MQTTDKDTLKGYDLVLDIAHPQGRSVWFRPSGDTLLRSEITQSMIPGKYPNQAIRLIGGTLPGLRIYMDTKQRACKILDRLTLEESETIVDSLVKLSNTEEYMNCTIPDKIRDADFGIPKDEYPVWLWWIKRLVDENKLRVVKGGSAIPKTHLEILEMTKNGEIRLSEDGGLKPNNKDDKPFNVVTTEQFLHEAETVGK